MIFSKIISPIASSAYDLSSISGPKRVRRHLFLQRLGHIGRALRPRLVEGRAHRAAVQLRVHRQQHHPVSLRDPGRGPAGVHPGVAEDRAHRVAGAQQAGEAAGLVLERVELGRGLPSDYP